jgi:NTE family protein
MKRALVVSGGGSKGAYSVGVIKALLESGRKYDVVAGVSVGALIGAHIASFPPDKQWENYAGLERVWTEKVRNNKSIYKGHAPGFLTYIWSLWKKGLYTMKPLRQIVAEEMKSEALLNSGVEFEVGVVSLQSGKYKAVNLSSNATNNEKAVDWIWASCIFPVLFEPVEIDGEQWVDGGVRDVIPIKDVMKYGVTHIDAVLTAPHDGYIKPVEKRSNTIDVGLRTIELLSDEIYVGDIMSRCKKEDVSLEIFDPKEDPNADGFTFDPVEICKLIELGYNETKAKLNLIT